MSQSANVKSVDAIREFRVSLITFAEEGKNALGGVEMELRRVRDWLTRDQLGYWQNQVKRSNEQLSMARTELHRRRLSQSNSDAISDTEQKEAVRAAQRRLDMAEEKVKRVKGWVPVLEHAIAEYHSSSQPLGDKLSGSLINSIGLLERILGSIEAYLSLEAPSAPSPAPTGSVGSPSSAGPSGPKAVPAADGEAVEAEAEVVEPEPDAAEPVSETTR